MWHSTSGALTRTENNPLWARSSIGIMDYTSSTGSVCTLPAFYPERAQNTFSYLWRDCFKPIILNVAFLSRCSSPSCHPGLKGTMTSASWNCHWEREGRPVHGGMAEWQVLVSGLPRIKWELPQSRSASHPLSCQLRKKKTTNKPQQIKH